jgi:hypothetical protein
MANCDKLIAQGVNASCGTPVLIAGLEDDAIIINRDDIDFAAVDFSTVPHGPMTLTMKTLKKGFKVKQLNDSFKGTGTELEKGRFKAKFKNKFSCVLFDKLGGATPTAALINQIANGRFVVVYENKTKNILGDINYEIMGLYKGLRAAAMKTDKYDEELEGAWTIELEESGVPEPPVTFWITSTSATKAAFEALV